jgi:hypothetical protein
MNPLKYKVGDKVYAKFLRTETGEVEIAPAIVLGFLPEKDRYLVFVYTYRADFRMIEEDLLTYVEAVAERLRGKVRL